MEHDTHPLRGSVKSGSEGLSMRGWFLMALVLDYLTSGEQRLLSSDEERQAREIKWWLGRFIIVVLLCSLFFFVMLFINH